MTITLQSGETGSGVPTDTPTSQFIRKRGQRQPILATPPSKVAVVTGGSGGIGREICIELALMGHAVVVNYYKGRTAALEVVREIKKAGGRAIAVQADVSRSSGCKKLVDKVLAVYKRIDVLVNNAGIARDNMLVRMKDEDIDATLDTNLKGAILCSREVVKRAMLRQRSGRIINMSSIVGLVGNSAQTIYAAAKAGLIGFTKSLAKELAKAGILVNAICPGFIDTPMTQALGAELIAKIKEAIPVKEFGLPRHVARAVAYLVGPDSDYTTGTELIVDGALSIH